MKRRNKATNNNGFTEEFRLTFSAIFRQYYTDLVAFAFGFVKDKAIAEEIVQDVFSRIWENRNIFPLPSSPKSFLLKSVQNKCIDWLRHLKTRNEYQSFVLAHPVLFENDTENYLLFSELRGKIDDALKELPEELAMAFKMSRLEGLTYPEIAQKNGVSVRTIEVRLSKALLILQERLKEYR